MFFHENRLQYQVRVDRPNPVFARMLQQAIGGVEGEIRVCLQYLFQAWGSRGPVKYRDMLMETGTEEIGHIEMLSTAVAMNLQNAPVSLQDEIAQDPIGAAVLSGMSARQILSSGLAALPADSDGVPFDCSHVYASGNTAADMYSNVCAESTGRLLATRLYHFTDDPGMKDMLSFLIARDTMHQNQWLAVLEEMGGEAMALPIPNSFPQELENQEFSYSFFSTTRDEKMPTPAGRWTEGTSIDGKGKFKVARQPGAPMPSLGPARPDTYGQKEQVDGAGGMLAEIGQAIDDLTKPAKRSTKRKTT
jgi:Mn-containing catalase